MNFLTGWNGGTDALHLGFELSSAITGLAAAAGTYYPQQVEHQQPYGHCGEDPMPPDCY
jgi:hypothetical protein